MDLRLFLNSGQVFNWRERAGEFFVAHSGHIIRLAQSNRGLQYSVFPPRQDSVKFVSDFLGLGRDYAAELSNFSGDAAMMASMRACPGLSISRQDPFECLLAFLISQNNNIARIRSTLLRLSDEFGENVFVDGIEFPVFPTPASLAGASLRRLRYCGLGYRAEYVKSAAKAVTDGFDLEGLLKTDYASAKNQLMSLDGVGPKVADCVLVFGLGFGEAFPVDLWIARIMRRHYAKRRMS
ncbi:MAG: DNA glycosylase, partial [Candidatus Micrarchaeota archaeon]